MNIVVIGAGMYVCGKGTKGYGTIMPAIFEWSKKNLIGKVYVAATSWDSVKLAKDKINTLKQDMGIDVEVVYFPVSGKNDSDSFKEAINKIPKPACAVVAVPDHLHKMAASFAIDSKLHTLVVKPLAPTLEEARELVSLQAKNGVYCACEFHKRFDHANLMLKDVISKGKIGDPLYFLAEFSQRKSLPSEIFKKWINNTNIFQYLGVHYVDIIYFATGATPKRVMAMGQKGWLAQKGINNYDSIQGTIEWEMASGKKFSSYILTNWIDPEKTSAVSDQKIKVIGTKGRFESDQKKRGITMVTDENGIEEPNPYFCTKLGQKGGVECKGYGIESVCQFLDDAGLVEKKKIKLEELENKRPTFRQSLVSTAVLDAVNKSLENNGAWIKIEDMCKYEKHSYTR